MINNNFRRIVGAALVAVLSSATVLVTPATTGGLLLYEVGTYEETGMFFINGNLEWRF